MSYKTPEYERIDNEGHQAHEDLKAILDEHLPADTANCAWRKIDAIAANNYEMAEYDNKRIYRALMGLIPEHAGEVRAAFQAVCFEGSTCNESDWLQWERGVQWPITPDFMDLLKARRDDDDQEEPQATG